MEIIVSLNAVSGIAAAVKTVQPRIRWHNVIHHTGLKLVWFTYLSLISMVPRYRKEIRISGLESVDRGQMANKKGHSTHLKVPAVRRTKIGRSKPSRGCHASVSDCVKIP